MNLMEDIGLDQGPDQSGAGIPVTPQEDFVKGVYALVDDVVASGLDRLRRDDGIVAMCKSGCSHCCRFHIRMDMAEAHTLGQYLKRQFSIKQLDELRMRTRKWHERDNALRDWHPSAVDPAQPDISGYDHSCPLLVDKRCSAYPVRPMVCRAHFVSSHPRFCYAAIDPQNTSAAPVVLNSIVTAADPLIHAIKERIENAGLEYSRSIMLLPHWMAVEMGWDFAVAA